MKKAFNTANLPYQWKDVEAWDNTSALVKHQKPILNIIKIDEFNVS